MRSPVIRRIDFLKVSGAGNDFVLVDNHAGSIDLDWVAFARAVCSRPFGVGSDGLVVIEPSNRVDFLMKYFNPDGSHGGMCGNGGRCAARYARETGISGSQVRFEALGQMYEAVVNKESVSLSMPDVKDQRRELRFPDGSGRTMSGFFLDTGSPHVVVSFPALEEADVDHWGRLISHHALLKPEGANVDFFSTGNARAVALRTFERGVEAETMACGTGAVATAVNAAIRLGMAPPISVGVRSGEILTVNFALSGHGAERVTLEGSAHVLFTGAVQFDTSTGTLRDPVPLR
jgi:diaminopimelate epimerase